MEERIISKVEESIKKIVDEGITTANLDHLYKLSKVKHLAKEDSQMQGNYGNYGEYSGRGPGHGSYGRGGYSDGYGEYGNYGESSYGRDSYGRRGRDARYRGHDHMDRMYGEYGRYEEGRRSYNEGNYGAKEDTLKSLEYMLESMVDFVEMLKSEANSQEEINLIRKYTKKISQM